MALLSDSVPAAIRDRKRWNHNFCKNLIVGLNPTEERNEEEDFADAYFKHQTQTLHWESSIENVESVIV